MNRMYILLLIYSLSVLTAYIIPYGYYSELFFSFLPYHGVILFLLLLTSCLQYPKYKKKTTKIMYMISLIVGISLTGYINNKRINFYQNDDFQSQTGYVQTDEQVGLTYFFANILKSNEDYVGLKKTIEELNPDVILLSEYKEHHHENLKDFFGQEYKYVNRIVGNQDIVGNVIFSKYPMEDFAPKVYQEARRYGYVAIKFEDKNYYFYHIHTSAPVDKKHRINRNEQLDKFGDSFIEQDHQRLPDDRVVVVGDFNLTPRSPTFTTFKDKVHLTHYSKFTGPITTRGYGVHNAIQYPLLQSAIRAHIDHMRFNDNVTFYDIQIIPIPGSDHDGIYARVK